MFQFYVTLLLFVFFGAFHESYSIKIIEKFDDPPEFKVYWNVPTFQCRPHKIYFNELAKKYNIVQNKEDNFIGDKMTILYDPGDFPAILNVDGQKKEFLRNGGVPQEGNLTDHMIHLEERILRDIPSEDYDGLAVIDFESWRPIYRQNWGTLIPYKTLSVDIEKQKHPSWTLAKQTAEATRRFEYHGRIYVENSLILGKSLRPNATWGYYAYPYCYNMAVNNLVINCGEEIQKENDRLEWLFEHSDGLYPSLYMPQERLSEIQRVQLIEGRIMESQRINKNLGNTKKIIPYFWYKYQDNNEMLTMETMRNSLIVLKSFNLDGMIIWGSSNDVNSRIKCQNLYDYVNNVLGPLILST